MNTDSIKKVIDLLVALVSAGEKIIANPANIANDIAVAFPLIQQIQSDIAAFGQVPAELKDLDQAELEDLIAYVEKALPTLVGSGKILSIIDAALSIVSGAVSFVKALKV